MGRSVDISTWVILINGNIWKKYSRMDLVKFVEDSLIWFILEYFVLLVDILLVIRWSKINVFFSTF